MNNTTHEIALNYYTAMSNKNISDLEKYLHPDVQFLAPLARVSGKNKFVENVKGFASFFSSIEIRSVLGSDDQAVVVYDVKCPSPIGSISTAALLTLEEELITKIELFYDARPFDSIK